MEFDALKKLLAGANQMAQKPQNMSVGEPAQVPQAEPQEIIEAANDATIEELNKKPKAPSLKTKGELEKDAMEDKADRTVAGQLSENNPEKDMLQRMRENISRYEQKADGPKKESNWQDHLPDMLAGAHNIMNYAQGSLQPNLKTDFAANKTKRQDELRKEDFGRLQELQKLYSDYQAKLPKKEKEDALTKYQEAQIAERKADRELKEKLAESKGKGEKGLTVGEEAVDKKYGELYNTFSDKGRSNAVNAIEKLEELQESVSKDTGFGEAGGTRFPIPDMLRSRLAVERRDDARNFANVTLKELFGGQLSDAEREAAAREFWNDELDNESNAKRLQGKIKELKDGLESQTKKAKYYEKHRTLSGYKGISDSVEKEKKDAPQDDIVERNGKTYKWNKFVGKYQLYNK